MAFLPATIMVFMGEPRSYLRYATESGLLRFDSNANLGSDHAFIRMEVELAGNTSDLVHLKCVYSNRYWRRSSETEWWLAAEAVDPVVDQSRWSCTLFRPEIVGSDGIMFQHMQTERYVGMRSSGSSFLNCLYVGTESTQTSRFKYMDWGQILLLPQFVAFKKAGGGQDGKYLQENSGLLCFESDDPNEQHSSHEIRTTSDGDIMIKCLGFWGRDEARMFWTTLENKIIFGDSGSVYRPFAAETDPATSQPKYISIGSFDGSVNAYRFCRPKVDNIYLYCEAPSMTNEARMELVERVQRRELYNYRFRETNGRIYDERVVDNIVQEFTNITALEYEAELAFEYTESVTRRWEHNVHVSAGVTTTVTTKIPFVAEASIEFRVEAGYSYTWGQEVTNSTTKTSTVRYTVPPRTKLVMTLIVSEAKLDLPFSYTQKDYFYTGGPPAIYVKHDGVFKGVNTSKFTYEPRLEAL